MTIYRPKILKLSNGRDKSSFDICVMEDREGEHLFLTSAGLSWVLALPTEDIFSQSPHASETVCKAIKMRNEIQTLVIELEELSTIGLLQVSIHRFVDFLHIHLVSRQKTVN